jgi:FtsZ-binding cell division protein ZapB
MEHSVQAYRSADQVWGNTAFISKQAKSLEKTYRLEVGLTGRQSMITSICAALENTLKVLDLIAEKGKVIYSDNEASMGLTFQKATVLRIVTIAEFANKYSLDLLNYIYTIEARATKGGEGIDDISKAEEEQLINQFQDFCVAMNVLKVDMSSLEKALNDLPDAVVSEMTERTFISTIGSKKLDPFQVRNFNVRKNPFYIFGMMVAERQEKKYKAKKETVELLQLRLMHLQKLRDKTQDASLDKEINYYQNRVTSLNHELEKLNKDYGLQ